MKRYILLIAITVIFPVVVFGAEGTTVKTFTTNIPFLDGELTTQGFVDAMYKLAIALASIIVVIRLMMAGAKYMLSDVVSSKSKAKEDIKNALFGLLIILGAVLLLGTINPKLVGLNFLNDPSKLDIKNTNNDKDRIDFTPGNTYLRNTLVKMCTAAKTDDYFAHLDEKCLSDNISKLRESCEERNGGKFADDGNMYHCNSK